MEQELKALTELVPELSTFMAKAKEELKSLGETKTETTEAIGKIQAKLDEAQKQLDAVDLKVNEKRFTFEEDGLNVGRDFVESDDFKAMKASDYVALRSKDGRFRKALPSLFGRKSTITNTSGLTQGTTGITMPMRLPGIQVVAQQALRIRDLMNTRQMTTGNAFDYVQQLTRTNNASPQVETSPKAESTYTWNSISDTVKTIAHFVNVSRQALDDVPWLQNMLNSELTYGLKVKEETEILSGDALGQHMNGIIKQATAYAGTYDVAGDTKLDKLRKMKLQARLAGLATFAPDGIVLNPVDLMKIETIKDETGGANKGRYIIGDPRGGTAATLLWGLPVVESDSIAAGTALIGAFGTAAELIDRMAAMIELSYENGSNFTNNIVTVLSEERLGLAVFRPGAFIYASSF